MTMQPLKGQRFLIVGGSSGIGLATAIAAVRAGALVTIASRSQDKLDAALASIGSNASAAVLDTTDSSAIERFFDGHAPWDHIVVSAAQTARGPVRKLPLDDAVAAMDSKFWGAYRIARSAQINQGGSLTFISGYMSERPQAAAPLQGAINAALESLARGLALELAPIRVNTVSPGLIETPLWSHMPDADRSAIFANAKERLPVRRIGQAEDIANAILFLATTPFTTGSNVRVDGGGTIA